MEYFSVRFQNRMKTVHRNEKIIEALWQAALIILMAVALSLGVNHFRHSGLPLLGERSSDAGSSGAATFEEPVVSMEEARALFLTNGAVFCDARPVEAYRYGHIQGALNLPEDNLDALLPDVMAKIPLDSVVIVYCDGQKCHLSKEVALQLSARGYSHVQVLVNGWSVWRDAGLPTETTGNGEK